jgi:hypothetical protein
VTTVEAANGDVDDAGGVVGLGPLATSCLRTV